VSSTQEIQAIRKTEQRFPTDLIHNGHQYRRGYKRDIPALRRAIEKVRMLRMHRVTA
jgi:hypothetical protein